MVHTDYGCPADFGDKYLNRAQGWIGKFGKTGIIVSDDSGIFWNCKSGFNDSLDYTRGNSIAGHEQCFQRSSMIYDDANRVCILLR